MRCARSDRLTLLAALLLAASSSCRRESPPPVAVAAPPSAADAATVPHGDHNPHHGGIVMMKGDLHYEVVVDPAGKQHHVYFTDAVREDLPASIASNAALTIHRPRQADERVTLAIDDAGESWIGGGAPVAVTNGVSVGLSFTLQGEPYAIELPLTSNGRPPDATAARPSPAR